MSSCPHARTVRPADGGGERFGGNTFLASNANTSGQFLFLITEGGPGGGVGAHFHARHFENFFALDGETLGWAHGKAVPLKTGDYFQAPPRNLHGFKLTQAYNRFAAFLTPGIFESSSPAAGQAGWRRCPCRWRGQARRRRAAGIVALERPAARVEALRAAALTCSGRCR